MAHARLGYMTSDTLASTSSIPLSGGNATSSSTGTSSSAWTLGSDGQPYRRPDCSRKLVVTGDGGIGKTCLLIVFAQQRFPEEYIPTVFETYSTQVQVGTKLIEVALWDTAGQEDYDRLRPLSYPESDVIFICYAVDYPTSLHNIEDKWHPEVSHFCEGVPTWLVATKIDLRDDKRTKDLLAAQGQAPLTPAQGMAVAKRIGAKYAECSAKSGIGVQELFVQALQDSLKGRSIQKIKKKTRCVFM